MLVPHMPSMDDGGFRLFSSFVESSSGYLEFGTGGSAVYAAEHGIKKIYAVETDKDFIELTMKKVNEVNPLCDFNPIFIDIGPTKEWGYPSTDMYIHRYPKYSLLPWSHVIDGTVDFVLVDGRFRVASFLLSLMSLESGAVVLFDDYVGRDHYKIVEQILQPTSIHGRMAMFEVKNTVNLPKLTAILSEYICNPL